MCSFRVIPKIEVKNNSHIKGMQFEGLRVVGSPEKNALKYYEQSADEIFYLDIVASLYDREIQPKIVKKLAENIFVPLTVGGGIKTLNNIEELLKNGADKVALNSHAIQNPNLIKEASQEFGRQCISLSVEAKQFGENAWEAYIYHGREQTGITVDDWIKKAQDLGIGEAIVTSIDCDGTQRGLDVALFDKVQAVCEVPLIFGGGLGNTEQLEDLKQKQFEGIVVGASLHFGKTTVPTIKAKLIKLGFNVR